MIWHTQDQNAIMNPNHEKKNTRPYMLKGLRPGMLLAFLLTGFNKGAFHNVVMLNILLNVVICLSSRRKFNVPNFNRTRRERNTKKWNRR